MRSCYTSIVGLIPRYYAKSKARDQFKVKRISKEAENRTIGRVKLDAGCCVISLVQWIVVNWFYSVYQTPENLSTINFKTKSVSRISKE